MTGPFFTRRGQGKYAAYCTIQERQRQGKNKAVTIDEGGEGSEHSAPAPFYSEAGGGVDSASIAPFMRAILMPEARQKHKPLFSNLHG
jgi:hypothetical protein